MNNSAMSVLMVVTVVILAIGSGCQKDAQAKLPALAHATAKQASAVVAAAVDTPSTPASAAPVGEGGYESLSTQSSSMTGALEPHRRATLTPRVGGIIGKVHVGEGDHVKKGDPLVSFETDDIRLRLRQAEEAARAARVQYDSAKLEWDRLKGLSGSGAVPQSTFDKVDAGYRLAEVGVAQTEVMLAMSRKAMTDAVVRAPFNSVVTRKFVSEGEYGNTMPPTNLVTVEEVEPIDLRVHVPSTDQSRVKVGDPLKVRFPATGVELETKVTRVVPSLDPRTRTFPVIAEIPNPGMKLRPGMFAEVRFGRE